MYYHCRNLKFVTYGKVFPPPEKELDSCFKNAYRWFGHYCGFFPQVWLSRSTSSITGIKNVMKNDILFGFDIIKGFSVRFDPWELFLSVLLNVKTDNIATINLELTEFLNELMKEAMESSEDIEEDEVLRNWVSCGCNINVFLKDHLFVKFDQVVVPSLNLKVAKKIICHNEKQKKKLRKMGFIEDRIKIMNIKGQKF